MRLWRWGFLSFLRSEGTRGLGDGELDRWMIHWDLKCFKKNEVMR
jgi:hypothetical protein